VFSSAIIVTFLLPVVIVAILVGGAISIVRMLLARRDAQMLTRDERAELQRLEALLGRMDERISNLETILMHTRAADNDRRGTK
jgi:phage shock protein B